MDYSQIVLEMFERIKVLEKKVADLEQKANNNQTFNTQAVVSLDKVSAKYRGLTEYLLSCNQTKVELTYDELEKILGFQLPETARKFKQSFWANTETHSYASSWLAVGYKTRVDVDSDTITFVKNLI